MTQLMFIVGAISLLGILLTPMHRLSLDRQTVLISSEALSTTTAVGQELLEEILVKKFDQNTTGTPADSSITSPYTFSTTLGPDGTEATRGDTSFNDIDDFNGFTKITYTPRIGNVLDTVVISYADTIAPYAAVGGKTWFKRIDVKVWNKYLPTQDTIAHSLTFSKIIAYRYNPR